MAIDTKDMQILASNVIKILMKSSFGFLKKHPIASCTPLSCLLLYIIFPSIFSYLICSLPFVVSIGFSIKYYSSVGRTKDINKDENGNERKSSRKIEFKEDDTRKYHPVHARSVRRRRAMKTISERCNTQSNHQEKGTVDSIRFTNDLVEKSALVEGKPKDIKEVEVESSTDRANCTSTNASKGFKTQVQGESFIGSQIFDGGVVEVERISSEDDEDEDTREDERQAVQWTEDDQKNLMDLGLSEIERNRRLESLIARRRSRKMLNPQLRRTLMNMGGNNISSQLSSITIPKHSPLLVGSNHFPSTPGSAPSVLLPMRNPFDLPYEPHEERPNLTGDSFQQEFMVAHLKDIMLCRHESFSLGAFQPQELKRDLHETSLRVDHGTKQVNAESPESPKVGSEPDLENDKKIITPKASQEAEPELIIENMGDQVTVQASERRADSLSIHHEELDGEVQTKSVIVEDYHSRQSSPSSSEEDEPFRRIDKDAILKSLSSLAPRSIAIDKEGKGQINDILCDYGPSVPKKTVRGEQIDCADKDMNHTPSHSIASDVQVEVSEVGSPLLTSDGNISSLDEEISICDGKIEKAVQSCDEDLLVTSSHLCGGDENESRSREIREVSEEDVIGVGFSRVSEKSGKPIASPLMGERVVEQDSIFPQFLSPLGNKPSEESKANTRTVNSNIHEEFQSSSPDLLQGSMTEVLAFLLHEKVQQSTGTSPSHPSCSTESNNLEEQSQPIDMSKEQSATILSHQGRHVTSCTDNKNTFLERGHEDRELKHQQNTPDMLNLVKTSDSLDAEDIAHQPEDPDIRNRNTIQKRGHEDRELENQGSARDSLNLCKTSDSLIAKDISSQPEQLDIRTENTIHESGYEDTELENQENTKYILNQCETCDSLTSEDIGRQQELDMRIENTIHERGHEDRELENQENTWDILDPCKTSDSSIAEDISRQLEEPNIRTVIEVKTLVQDNGNSRSSEKFKGATEYLSQVEDVAKTSQLVKSNEIQDTKVTQTDGSALSSLAELGVASVCIDSTLSILPGPNLQENAEMDQSYPSNSAKLVHTRVQESDREMKYHNGQSVATNESSQARNPQNALQPTGDSRLYSCNGHNAESSSSEKSNKQSSTINNVDDSENFQNNDKDCVKTSKEVDIHISTNEGEQAEKSETTYPRTFVSHGSELKGLVGPTIISNYGTLAGEISRQPLSEETKGMSENIRQYEEMIIPIQGNSFPESPISGECEPHSAVVATSTVSQDTEGPAEMELMPEVVDQQVSNTLGSTLSPKSVLQQSFSMKQRSVTNLSNEVEMEIHQSHRYPVESYTVEERRRSSLTSTALQSADLIMDDRNAEPAQESSTPSTMPIEEANSNQSHVNELMVHDTKMQTTKPNEFSKDTSGRLSSHETIAEQPKQTEGANSIRGKDDEIPEYSTSHSNTADQWKNFDMP